jgi:hypothetical protein
MLYEPGNSCEICSQKQGSLSFCKMCNASVCESCRVADDEICINCQEARCRICEEFLSSRACNRCGILVCEDHGIKINESTLCDNCRKSDE